MYVHEDEVQAKMLCVYIRTLTQRPKHMYTYIRIYIYTYTYTSVDVTHPNKFMYAAEAGGG